MNTVNLQISYVPFQAKFKQNYYILSIFNILLYKLHRYNYIQLYYSHIALCNVNGLALEKFCILWVSCEVSSP